MRLGRLRSLVLAALVVCVLSNLTWRKRRQERALLNDAVAELAADEAHRFVDAGVELRTVVADPSGDELLSGKPRLSIVRARRYGGIIDTRAHPRAEIVRPSTTPRIWYCSLDQETVILHGGDPLGQLVYGSEGAGKTTVTAMWHYMRWIEHLGEGREGGQTAPTIRRLKLVLDEIARLYAPGWFTFRGSKQLLVFADGTRLQFTHTHRRSEAEGSPIQGYNWSWCAREEGQDQIEAHADIEARGRAAKAGRYQQLITATAKDSPQWRDFRDQLTATNNPLWIRRTLLGRNSPFVEPARWDAMRATMTEREYQRRVLAMDVHPELAVYYGWDRNRNLVAAPRIATDVTAAVLGQYRSYLRPASRFVLVASHDPGVIYNTTTIQRLLMFGDLPTWVVVGELQTKQTTPGEHAARLRAFLQTEFGVELVGVDASKCAIFCDPHGKGESQTDYQTVYMAFQHEGLDVFSPAPQTGKIKRAARVAMINRLLRSADGRSRLVVGVDEHRRPLAPRLVDAFETLEKREGDDDAEGHRRKDETDKTHAPAALAYGLWPFEQEAFTATTVKLALAEARRYGAG